MITDPSFWFYMKHGVVWQDKHCSGLGVGVLWIVTFCPEEPMGWCLAAEEVKGKGCGYRKCLSEVLYPFCPGYTCNFFSSCAVLRSSRSGSSLGGAAGGCCLQMQHNESVVVHHNTLQDGYILTVICKTSDVCVSVCGFYNWIGCSVFLCTSFGQCVNLFVFKMFKMVIVCTDAVV